MTLVSVKASYSRKVGTLSFSWSMLFSLNLYSHSIELLTCCKSYFYCNGVARDAEKEAFIMFP
jgi:hypothetical protein